MSTKHSKYSITLLAVSLLAGLTPIVSAQTVEFPGKRSTREEIPTAPDDLIFEQNLRYREGDERWALNVIRPKQASSTPRPAIVVVHGGGWSGNDHYRFTHLGFLLAHQGYVVITPTHRMIRDAPFPACLKDIKNSVRWLRAHAKKYNVDPQRIGAYGNSSGGHLALMTGLTSTHKELEGEGPYQDRSSALQAVVCSGTVGDMTHAQHSDLAKRVYRSLVTGRNSDLSEDDIIAVMKQASPNSYVSKQAPPSLMIHGGKDAVVFIQSTDEFVEQMKAAGADITYRRHVDSGHGVMFQRNLENVPAMTEFFAKHLKPLPAAD